MRKIFIISLIVLIIDIISKRLVISLMDEFESIEVINNFFRITYAQNEGVAFSLLDGYVPLIIVVTLMVILFLFKYAVANTGRNLELFGYSFILGGAIGNLLDRICYGYVVDFLDFKIFGYDFAIFNLADTFIVIGVFLLLLVSFKEEGIKNGISSRKKCSYR